MKLKKRLVALGAAMLLGASGMANAAIQVDNWVIDLGAIGNLAGGDKWAGYGMYGTNVDPGPPVTGHLGLSQLTFNAIYHADIAGPLALGTLQHTDTLGVVTSGVNSDGLVSNTTTGKILNSTSANGAFELTFASTTTQKIISLAAVPGGFNVGNTHLAAGTGPNGVATNGFLNIYADIYAGANNGDGSVKANSSIGTGGAGMDDGLLIATFEIISAGGIQSGTFNTAALDGADDASFRMVYNYMGIVKDSLGNSLPTTGAAQTLAFTNSNTDADDNNNGIIDQIPSGWGTRGLGACGTTVFDNCGLEDGSLNLAAVPEPASVALVGAALLGLGLSRRRQHKQ